MTIMVHSFQIGRTNSANRPMKCDRREAATSVRLKSCRDRLRPANRKGPQDFDFFPFISAVPIYCIVCAFTTSLLLELIVHFFSNRKEDTDDTLGADLTGTFCVISKVFSIINAFLSKLLLRRYIIVPCHFAHAAPSL